MHRLLIAAAAVSLVAASPALAFNLNTFGQFGGGNFGTSYQKDNFVGANSLTGAQVGSGNFIDNGYCTDFDIKKNKCNAGPIGQDAAPLSANNAIIFQIGDENATSNRQKASSLFSLNNNVLVQSGKKNVFINVQNAKDSGSVNDQTAVQIGQENVGNNTQNASKGKTNKSLLLQGGYKNVSVVDQDSKSATNSTTGNNDSTVVQLIGKNESYVIQKGGNEQVTGQLGWHNVAVTNQDHSSNAPNQSLTLQGGVDNYAATTQAGGSNDAVTLQGGYDNASSVAQTGSNNSAFALQLGEGNTAAVSQSNSSAGSLNWSSVSQVGTGNTFVSIQTN